MKFLEPQWLWGLLVVPIFYFLILLDEKRRKEQFRRFADQSLWKFLAPELNFGLRFRKSLMSILALAFGLLALARPQWGSHEETIEVTGLDVVLVLDVSSSMWTEDVVPSRLQKMKHWVRNLLSSLEGDRVGVVAFAASTAVVCPLTSDLSYVWDTVQILDPKMMKNQGTDIGLALQTASQAIERGAEEVSGHSHTPVASRVVVLISDGEDHENQALAEADRFKERGIKFYVFGVGTEKGGPIPVRDDLGSTQGYKRDRKGDPIVSAFHSEYLAGLASRGGGKYWAATSDEIEVKQLVAELGGLTRGDYSERRFLVYEDRFQIPLAVAVLLLILEISIPVRNLLGLVFLFSLGLFPVSARADGYFSLPAPLEGYYETKKGLKAYNQGNLEEAQRSFGSAQALDPSRPELEFNQGVLQLRQGDFDRAIESFKNSTQLAEKSNQPLLQGKSLYNLGSTYAKKGEAKDAIRSYSEAIQLAIKNGDTRLEEEARKNLQLVLDQKKKREQQKQDQEKQSKQDQKKQDQQEQKQGEQKEQKGDHQNQNESSAQQDQSQKQPSQGAEREKQYQQTEPWKKKDDFKSQKMTSEDADRVLNELKARERDLQEKLKKKNGNQQNQAKDW